jgi:PAP2 superfamily
VRIPSIPARPSAGRFAGRLPRLGVLRARQPPPWRSLRWPFVAYAAGVVALALSRRRLRLPRPVMVPVVSTTPLAVAAAVPRSKLQYAATWASYVWLFKVAWEIPYDKPEKLRPKLRVRYPIRVDTAIGFGVPPGVRLQRALRRPPTVTVMDRALTALHYGLWAAPHAALGWMLVRREEDFPRAAGRLAAVYHFTTLGYWYLPTAPPWWASEEGGELGGAIQRVTREVNQEVKAKLGISGGLASWDPLGEGNPWGSMPSDALPAAAATARTLAEINPAAGAIAWGLTAVDGFTLVYLGEHHVIDLIVGLALVELIWRGEPLALPLVRTGTAALRALERRVVG